MPVSDTSESAGGEPDRVHGSATEPMVSPDVEAVIERWNPQGMALLRAVPESGAASVVTMIGPDDVNTTLLRTELTRFEPRIALSDPVSDASATRALSMPGAAASMVALILLDAGTTVGVDLLDLIGALRADGSVLVLAMNGVHSYQDWRIVLERDRELLAARGITDVDIVPVSARLATAARTKGDAGLLDRSGLAALHLRLTAAASGTTATRGDRLAAVTRRVLADTRARVTEQMEALRAGEDVARLRQERATLLAGRDGGRATAMSALRGGLHLARVDLMTDVGARTRTLHTTARAEVDRLRPAAIRGYPDRLQHAVVELTGALDHAIDHRLAELGAQIEDADRLPARRRDPAPPVGPDPEPRHRGAEDHLMIALGASAGVGLGRLAMAPLSLVPALDIASVPLTLLVGAGAAAWVVRARGQVADRAHFRQWIADAVVNIKAHLEQRVATALVEAETDLADHVVRASTARTVEVDRRISELETELRRIAANQPGQLAACERDIRTLDHWISVVETRAGMGTR
ncbi:hypothetical protein [Nocardia sp. CNY236]|uniref:hypothetical protein n=1 Tax=Nocardia sp. CNY236 TaxID=1169152 RepID=UPI0004155AD1|nr:hypothetical protein [Nocardia sp. CNY236]